MQTQFTFMKFVCNKDAGHQIKESIHPIYAITNKQSKQASKPTLSTASLEILGSSSMVRELRLVALENSTGVSSSLKATTSSSNTLPFKAPECPVTEETHKTFF
jgi:hypothetical protein